MSYFDTYKSRLNSYGHSPKDAQFNVTANVINKSFTLSPSFKKVLIDEIETDVIVNLGKTNNDRKIMFRPFNNTVKGSVVTFDGDSYLIVDTIEHDLYPEATIKLCNNSLSLHGEVTPIEIGRNSFNEPIYEYVENDPLIIPCIAETTIQTDDTTMAINLPEGRTNVTLKFTEHDKLKLGEQFTLYDEQYNIIGIDYTKSVNKVGLMILQGEKVSK